MRTGVAADYKAFLLAERQSGEPLNALTVTGDPDMP